MDGENHILQTWRWPEGLIGGIRPVHRKSLMVGPYILHSDHMENAAQPILAGVVEHRVIRGLPQTITPLPEPRTKRERARYSLLLSLDFSAVPKQCWEDPRVLEIRYVKKEAAAVVWIVQPNRFTGEKQSTELQPYSGGIGQFVFSLKDLQMYVSLPIRATATFALSAPFGSSKELFTLKNHQGSLIGFETLDRHRLRVQP